MECITELNVTCVEDYGRVCIRNNETGSEECGIDCADGFVEFDSALLEMLLNDTSQRTAQRTCWSIDSLDETIVQLMIDVFKPKCEKDLTLQERLSILKERAWSIESRSGKNVAKTPAVSTKGRMPKGRIAFALALGKYAICQVDELLSLRRTVVATFEELKSSGFKSWTKKAGKKVWNGIEKAWDYLFDRARRSLPELPAAVDWCEEGACTEVKDCQSCGCDWAAATAAAIESGVYLTSGILESLSFQQMVSCDGDNNGCNGGTVVSACGVVRMLAM